MKGNKEIIELFLKFKTRRDNENLISLINQKDNEIDNLKSQLTNNASPLQNSLKPNEPQVQKVESEKILENSLELNETHIQKVELILENSLKSNEMQIQKAESTLQTLLKSNEDLKIFFEEKLKSEIQKLESIFENSLKVSTERLKNHFDEKLKEEIEKIHKEMKLSQNKEKEVDNSGLMNRQTLSISETIKYMSELKSKETHLSFNEITDNIANTYRSLAMDVMKKEVELWYEGWKFEPNPYKLTENEVKSICLYTHDLMNGVKESNFYYQLNDILRTRKSHDLNIFSGYLYYMLSGLRKLPNIATTLYRGIPNSHRAKVERDYIINRPIHWSGFSSGTDDLTTARSFAGEKGVIFEIKIFNGKSIAEYSFNPNETEILLSPNMKFKVVQDLKERSDGYFYLQLQEESALIY